MLIDDIFLQCSDFFFKSRRVNRRRNFTVEKDIFLDLRGGGTEVRRGRREARTDGLEGEGVWREGLKPSSVGPATAASVRLRPHLHPPKPPPTPPSEPPPSVGLDANIQDAARSREDAR